MRSLLLFAALATLNAKTETITCLTALEGEEFKTDRISIITHSNKVDKIVYEYQNDATETQELIYQQDPQKRIRSGIPVDWCDFDDNYINPSKEYIALDARCMLSEKELAVLFYAKIYPGSGSYNDGSILMAYMSSESSEQWQRKLILKSCRTTRDD